MEKLKMHSPDLTAQNMERIAELFPNCITESRDEKGNLKRAIDFDQLRQELSDVIVDGPQERYQITWPGKREALLLANAPVAKTLRPHREESVDFDITRNLFIEGDNLEALKLIQETYLNSVKLIYIDPPYNTGSDLVYEDDFARELSDYLLKSSQKNDIGGRLVANPETHGRFHSAWMTMIYPRLKLAKNLLKDDGLILVSIDDNEFFNLRKLMDEVFGESNFVATMVWEKGRKNDAKFVSVGHEYIIIFAKSVTSLREKGIVWREEKPGAREIWDKYVELRRKYGDDDKPIEAELQEWYSSLPKNHPSKKWSRYKRIDKYGPWRDRDISWPGGGGPRYEVIHPRTQLPCKIPEAGWRFSAPEEMQRQIRLGLVEFRDDHTQPPFRKAHIRPIPAELETDISDGMDEDEEEEFATQVRGSCFYKQSQVAVKYLRELLGAKAFNNPKDHIELEKLIRYVTSDEKDCMVMDFFAGSGSTAHAVFAANANDGGARRFVVVQLPEELSLSKKEQKVAAAFCEKLGRPKNIAEIAKERIRRAGTEIKEAISGRDNPPLMDVGFRVLKVDSSNMEEVYYTPDAVRQDDLFSQIDNVRDDRTPEDLLFQVLIDWGVDLGLSITQETIAGKNVFFVDTDALAACFEKGITEEFVKELAQHKPLRVVFRDASFSGDSVKINVEQIFRLLSPATEIKTV